MRVLILSDLHDDFWSEFGRNPFEGVEGLVSEVDHILLAGDLSNKPKIRWGRAFERLSRLLPLDRVSIFPGNHDFYDFRIDGEDRLAEIATSFGVSYVQKQQLELGNSRILCATLWTDFEIGAGSALNKGVISAGMNDYKKIRVAARGYRRLWPSDVVSLHKSHLLWLSEKLSDPFNGTTYVATHHAPHPAVLRERKEGLDAAYASDLSDLILQHRPKAWFFGHSHDAVNMKLGETDLRNVSLGYPDEVSDPSNRIKACIFEI